MQGCYILSVSAQFTHSYLSLHIWFTCKCLKDSTSKPEEN